MSKNKHVHGKVHKSHEEHKVSDDYRDLYNSTYEVNGVLTHNPYVAITKSHKSI